MIDGKWSMGEIRPLTHRVVVGDSAWRYRWRRLLGDRWQRLTLPADAPVGIWMVPASGEQAVWDGRSFRRGWGVLRPQFVSEGTVLVHLGSLGVLS